MLLLFPLFYLHVFCVHNAANVSLFIVGYSYGMEMNGKEHDRTAAYVYAGPNNAARLAEEGAENPLWVGNSCCAMDELPINTAAQHSLGTGHAGARAAYESVPSNGDVSAHHFTADDDSQVRIRLD